jgi:hypothetical protein
MRFRVCPNDFYLFCRCALLLPRLNLRRSRRFLFVSVPLVGLAFPPYLFLLTLRSACSLLGALWSSFRTTAYVRVSASIRFVAAPPLLNVHEPPHGLGPPTPCICTLFATCLVYLFRYMSRPNQYSLQSLSFCSWPSFDRLSSWSAVKSPSGLQPSTKHAHLPLSGFNYN